MYTARWPGKTFRNVTSRPHFTVTLLFTNWRFVATLHWANLWAPSPQQHLLTPSPDSLSGQAFVVTLAMVQASPLVLYLLWRSVISGLWCGHCDSLRAPQATPHTGWQAYLVNVCVLRLHGGRSPTSLLLGPPCSLRQSEAENRPSNSLTTASKESSERKSHMSLTSNRKSEIIKLSKEGMSKTKTALKPGLLCQTAKKWVQKKVLEGN